MIVQKFGGTSVGNIERMHNVAKIILDEYKRGRNPVVVASAMSGQTNKLEALIQEITTEHNQASDMVLASGEQVSIGLLSLIINKIATEYGFDKNIAKPMLSYQAGISGAGNFGDANISSLSKQVINSEVSKGRIPILPGFQCWDNGDLKTLGRGGSDTSAVALATLLKADQCNIYTDVEGVYSADPRLYPEAIKFDQISTYEMLKLSKRGAKVMHHKAVELGHKHRTPICVKSTFKPEEKGTLIYPSEYSENNISNYFINGVVAKDINSELKQTYILGLKLNSPKFKEKLSKLFKAEKIEYSNINVSEFEVGFQTHTRFIKRFLEGIHRIFEQDIESFIANKALSQV